MPLMFHELDCRMVYAPALAQRSSCVVNPGYAGQLTMRYEYAEAPVAYQYEVYSTYSNVSFKI